MQEQRGLHHVGVTVTDLDVSLDWYRKVFGLVADVDEVGSGPELCATVELDDVDLRFAFLNVGNTNVELLQYRHPPGRGFDLRNNDIGASHICLMVDDVLTAFEKLSADGIVFNAPPMHLRDGAMKGHTIVYLRDPDGIQLELISSPAA